MWIKGKHHSAETRHKIGLAQKGKPKPKVSIALRGRAKPERSSVGNPMFGRKRPDVAERNRQRIGEKHPDAGVKISNLRTGKHYPKLSEAKKGIPNPLTKGRKNPKISASLKGRLFSVSHKEKLKLSWTSQHQDETKRTNE